MRGGRANTRGGQRRMCVCNVSPVFPGRASYFVARLPLPSARGGRLSLLLKRLSRTRLTGTDFIFTLEMKRGISFVTVKGTGTGRNVILIPGFIVKSKVDVSAVDLSVCERCELVTVKDINLNYDVVKTCA